MSLAESPRTLSGLQRWYRLLVAQVSAERLEPRRNRIKPRVIKRKMGNWAKKRKNTVISRSQPWHSALQSSWWIEGY